MLSSEFLKAFKSPFFSFDVSSISCDIVLNSSEILSLSFCILSCFDTSFGITAAAAGGPATAAIAGTAADAASTAEAAGADADVTAAAGAGADVTAGAGAGADVTAGDAAPEVGGISGIFPLPLKVFGLSLIHI